MSSNLSLPTGPISSAYDGVSIKHLYVNPKNQRVVLYAQNEGMYDSLLTCKSGVANADNSCVCQGSNNSMPYNIEPNMLGKLFTPEQPGMFPQPTQSMKCLIAERSQWSPYSEYRPFLGTCDQ